MKDIVTYISPLIESQFPSFYREDGQVFVTFVKAYYEWLEQANNTLYHSRRLLEYRDVDQTVDNFLVHFKEETLKNIQFDTATNKRLFIKNALDFYRSKGTERFSRYSIFLVLSTGSWKKPEISPLHDLQYLSGYIGSDEARTKKYQSDDQCLSRQRWWASVWKSNKG